jgi:hypothetical protein
VTDEGRARVGQNSITHGLTATRLVVREDEREEFEALRADLLNEHSPQGATETITFNDILHGAWTVHRCRRLEAEAASGTLLDVTHPDTFITLERIARYQARAQRSYYRALKELRLLQTNRVTRALTSVGDNYTVAPVLTDIARFNKEARHKAEAEGGEDLRFLLKNSQSIINSLSKDFESQT